MDAVTPKSQKSADQHSHVVRPAQRDWLKTRFPGCEVKTLLFDRETKAGEFVWRETGSRHVAWTPEGGLMLAMFQIPNKFYERDGRVTDVAGQDWETVWGRALKQ